MAFFKMLCCVVVLYIVGVNGLREYLRFSDLRAVGASAYTIRDYFHNYYGTTPDGVAMNDEGRFRTVHPPVTVRYPHKCYKQIGTVTYRMGSSTPPSLVVLDSQTVENSAPEEAIQEVTVKAIWEDRLSHSTTRTIGLTFSQKLTIKAIFEAGMQESFSTSTSESRTTTQRQEISRTIRVRVPGHSKRTVQLKGKAWSKRVYYQAPISVYGYVGANFPHRVRGHYFWFHNVAKVFPKRSGTLYGSATKAKVSEFYVTISVATALTT